MDDPANSDHLMDLAFLIALLCLVAFASVVLVLLWRSWFRRRAKPDKPD
jgi:membrane protein implicated in regulation of membrane protease activity